MNEIIPTIFAASVILLVCALLLRGGRGSNSDQLQGEVPQRLEDENGDRTQQSEPAPNLKENVTPSPTTAGKRSRCAACGALITANDERCPSCDIAFVAEGLQKWTLGAVGPADGIYLPQQRPNDGIFRAEHHSLE